MSPCRRPLLLALLVLTLAPAVARAQTPPEPRLRATVDGAPGRGATEPLVTIVEFSDFQCPFCSRVSEPLARLLEAHPDDVRIVFRHNPLPFHPAARPAAALAVEAQEQLGDAGFWLAHDRLFQNQRALERSDLERYARELGLDGEGVRRALDENKHQARLDADMRLARDLGATGTPTFFVNGRKLVGARPFEDFEAAVQRELGEARALLRRGVRRADLYARLMRDALATAPPAAAQPSSPSAPAPPQGAVRVPVGASPQQGPADALVTVVVFSDFQCPFCSRLRPTLLALRERYGADLRLVWKNNPLPFHTNAMPAAEAAAEAFAQGGADKFWQMHDLLMQNQQALARDDLLGYAGQLGLDVRRFTRALDQHTHQASIQADMNLATELGARGTPASFVNGRNLRGAQPLEAFTALVDTELAAARERVRRGTPRARIYETLPVTAVAAAAPPAAPPAPPVPEGAPEAPVNLPVPRDAPALGPRTAPVTIQVFADFQCPWSARLRGTLAELVDRYPDRVRIVWRHLPLDFHPFAQRTAEAAIEARRQGGDAMFWELLDRFYDHQAELSEDRIRALAVEVGMNAATLDTALSTGRHRARVRTDVDAITRVEGASGTPTMFVNGRKLPGAQPLEALVAAVERALTERPTRGRARRRSPGR